MEARGDHSRGHTSEGSYPVPWVQWSHHYTPCSVGPPPCRPPAVCVCGGWSGAGTIEGEGEGNGAGEREDVTTPHTANL